MAHAAEMVKFIWFMEDLVGNDELLPEMTNYDERWFAIRGLIETDENPFRNGSLHKLSPCAIECIDKNEEEQIKMLNAITKYFELGYEESIVIQVFW